MGDLAHKRSPGWGSASTLSVRAMFRSKAVTPTPYLELLAGAQQFQIWKCQRRAIVRYSSQGRLSVTLRLKDPLIDKLDKSRTISIWQNDSSTSFLKKRIGYLAHIRDAKMGPPERVIRRCGSTAQVIQPRRSWRLRAAVAQV